MTRNGTTSPFHEGERAAQQRAGVGDMTAMVGGFIRDYLPEQHRTFHTGLPFLVASGSDATGRVWVTLIEGPDEFASSPDARRIILDTRLAPDDPLAGSFRDGTEIGVLGIELASRRRNRFSGHVRAYGDGYSIDIRQTFGNCPQYIHERAVTRVETIPGEAKHSVALDEEQIARIRAADTLFIGSGHPGAEGIARGYDASHRGGVAGFVQIVDGRHLLIPDYAGNNFFNTIGNLVSDSRVGLLFIDFASGGLLHLTGRATIDWSPSNTQDSGALRMIQVEIDAVIDRPGAVSLRWAKQEHLTRQLQIARKVRESDEITSFYLVPTDELPLEHFEAGQHLPIAVPIPGVRGTSRRSYSLSGPPQEQRFYRISVKRESKGLVSRFLHDQAHEGTLIDTQKPAGEFLMPGASCPLVLVSGGVGLTPMLSVLWANASQQDREVWFIHGTRNSASYALGKEVDHLIAANSKLHRKVFFSRPEAGDRLGRDYYAQGRVTAQTLLDLNAGPNVHYMLCGPAQFISDIQSQLEANGIPADQIHFETFGPVGQAARH